MKGKIALITGSTRGLGKAIATKLATEGCTVVLNDSGRDRAKGEELSKELSCDYIPCDVSNKESVEKLISAVKEKHGTLDILVNNAGITRDKTLIKMSEEEWNSVINANLNSIFYVTQSALPIMNEGGRVINVSSIAGLCGNYGQTNYSATKAALIGFSKSLAKEVGKRKITVNVIAPGLIKSDMSDKIPMEMLANIVALIPLREVGKPEDIASTVSFLASDAAAYITGAVIRVDGGLNF